ncbi:hypothetical protein D1F64_17645 [Breoghania sp. L-A4]|nr:hypothetical protein D1F64_17645 [Breoghania sp. L-A4]
MALAVRNSRDECDPVQVIIQAPIDLSRDDDLLRRCDQGPRQAIFDMDVLGRFSSWRTDGGRTVPLRHTHLLSGILKRISRIALCITVMFRLFVVLFRSANAISTCQL